MEKKGYLFRVLQVFIVKHKVAADLQGTGKIVLELDDAMAPKTVRAFLDCLPLETRMNVWGEELYTDCTAIKVGAENARALVDLYDVAYWPQGSAVCLFFGPTPIGSPGEIRPYSPVNVFGRMMNAEKGFVKRVRDGATARFELAAV